VKPSHNGSDKQIFGAKQQIQPGKQGKQCD
jgi:hypothetical protein